MSKRIKIVSAVLAVVLSISLVSAVAVSADSPEEAPLGALGRAGGRVMNVVRSRLNSLAQALGLSQEEVQDAFREGKTIRDLADQQGMTLQEVWDAVQAANKDAQRKAIAERVASGDLSQDKADWLLEGIDMDWQPNLRGLALACAEAKPMEALAEELGLTVDELRLQLWGGARPQELAEEAGLDWDTVVANLQARAETAIRDAVEQAVDEGTLSADQADWLIRGLDAGYIAGPDAGLRGGPLGGMPMGGRPGRGGMRGGPGFPGGQRPFERGGAPDDMRGPQGAFETEAL